MVKTIWHLMLMLQKQLAPHFESYYFLKNKTNEQAILKFIIGY